MHPTKLSAYNLGKYCAQLTKAAIDAIPNTGDARAEYAVQWYRGFTNALGFEALPELEEVLRSNLSKVDKITNEGIQKLDKILEGMTSPLSFLDQKGKT